MRIARPDDLTDLASLGLTLAEGKQFLAGVQREIVAAQARVHGVRRPECRGCRGACCRVKDYRHHGVGPWAGQGGELELTMVPGFQRWRPMARHRSHSMEFRRQI